MQADISRLYRDVAFLTGLQPSRNYLHLSSLEKASDYIREEFRKTGLSTQDQTWLAEGNEYRNIIASFNEQKTERLIVGAHYDVCGDQPGADDNASAVAGLLETARLVAAAAPDLSYRIDFVAYCLEEPPFFATDLMGSYVHAAYLKENNIPVLGMIGYEMIGYFSEEPGSQQFPFPELKALYPDKGNFIIVVGLERQKAFVTKVHERMKKDAAIDVQSICFPDPAGLAGLSDHRNYWRMGYNAVMINDTSFMRNPHYHEKSDTIETLNFDKMSEVVNSCVRMVMNMK